MGSYLNAFTERTTAPELWLRSATHARLLSDAEPIELSGENYAAVREGTIRRIASEPTSGEEPPTLARMLRFARDSKGISLATIAEQCGTSPQTIHNYATGRLAPDDDRLRKIVGALDLSRDSLELFAAALPAAQAFASTVRPFSEKLSALVEAYGGRAQFADAVGLSDRITEEQLDLLLEGAPPGERLGSYLNAFTERTTAPELWLRSATHARLLSDAEPIELSAENYAVAREEMLRQFASEPAAGKGLRRLRACCVSRARARGCSGGDGRESGCIERYDSPLRKRWLGTG